MKNKFLEKLSRCYQKFRSSRPMQIMLIVAIALIIIGCYFAFTNKKPESDLKVTSSQEEYVEYLETKLENTISKIDGAGAAEVIITLESGFSYVYATNTETKTNSQGTTTSSSLVLKSGEPILEKEIYPVIRGVVVVCKGAQNLGVKQNILKAIQTVLELDSTNITILY